MVASPHSSPRTWRNVADGIQNHSARIHTYWPCSEFWKNRIKKYPSISNPLGMLCSDCFNDFRCVRSEILSEWILCSHSWLDRNSCKHPLLQHSTCDRGMCRVLDRMRNLG